VGRFGAKYAGKNMRNLAKNALKYVAYMLHICGIAEICGVNDACACLRWTKCAEMLKNVTAYAEICDFLHNLRKNKYSKCINKYSKF